MAAPAPKLHRLDNGPTIKDITAAPPGETREGALARAQPSPIESPSDALEIVAEGEGGNGSSVSTAQRGLLLHLVRNPLIL